jgi:hypothetical protein
LTNYTYDSKQSKIEFRYDNIEKQIINRFIQTKALINKATIKKFEYSDEMTDMSILIHLNQSIDQETIEPVLQRVIYSSFKHINDISESLHVLKIIINYGCTTESDGNLKLINFAQMIYSTSHDNMLFRTKFIEQLQLKHLKHLWLLISMKRAVLLTLNDQDPFETLEDIFREKDAQMSGIDGHLLNKDSYLTNSYSEAISLAFFFYQFLTIVLCDMKMDSEEKALYKTYNLTAVLYELDVDSKKILIPDNMKIDQIASVFENSTVQLRNSLIIWNKISTNLAKFDENI